MTTDGREHQEGKIPIHVDPDLADLVQGFLDKRRKDTGVLLTALDGGDFETIRILGHSMKGSGGGYGFDAISVIGAALEQAAKRKNPDEIRQHVHELSRYLERVEVLDE
ncbi:MAG: Hpt domain-containing protein [Nitrospiraceae bacterium]|nr:Hpt domain-containing protein [Nitrospiraceae bacterium]